jgi:NADH:ubiquinone oxidoreductase subunit 6 (subunit J)
VNTALIIIALFTLGTAAVALSLRNLIHSVLLLVASWVGVAAFYLWAGAEFVGFAQVLVYVGAVSMVVLFAVLLTRARPEQTITGRSPVRGASAIAVGSGIFVFLAYAAIRTPMPVVASSSVPQFTVRQLGLELMGAHVAALMIVGIILTVALLGGIVIASTSRSDKEDVS